MNENQKFEEIISRGMEEYFQRHPRIAVKFGKEEYEKVVESGTAEHIRENLKWSTDWIDQLKKLDNVNLSFENQITLKAMEYYHDINLFLHEVYPIWKKIPNGLAYIQEILRLLFQRKGPTIKVAEAIIIHLNNLPKYLEEFQSRFDEAPIPITWRNLALKQIQSTPNFFQTIAEAFYETTKVPNTLKRMLQNAFNESESIIQKHIEWINSLLIDENQFAWALGQENFDKLLTLRKLPWNRETILKKTTSVVNSLFKRFRQIAKEIDPTRAYNEVLDEFFKQDQIPTFQEHLEHSRSEALRAKEFIHSKNLMSLPEEKLIIVETPPHLIHTSPTALYGTPPYYSRDQPGVLMLTPPQNEDNFIKRSYVQVSVGTVHETYPGHHLDMICNNQFAPPSRLLFSDIYRIDPFETIEGWAHYCEEMMLKQGFHKDPINGELWMLASQSFCARKVVLDIQMHCKQLTQDDAIKILANHLRNEGYAKAEIARYTSTPGMNFSYLIGKLLIEDLRREVEEKMGNKFSLKFFHDTILKSGDLPYCLLKEYFNEIIKKKKNNS
jgi:uncharacterized protein (DUF885 family)